MSNIKITLDIRNAASAVLFIWFSSFPSRRNFDFHSIKPNSVYLKKKLRSVENTMEIMNWSLECLKLIHLISQCGSFGASA